ncbi:G/U mismatch-specific uracil-DNA glycosylase [Aureococcus anophagefferens]|nr:G/U mismatch-specific uracil-DNA glycosylase [Aureococcus anophagefferens]
MSSTPVKRRRTAAAPNATPSKKRATTSPHFSGPAKGSFGPLLSATVAPHTLLLGTQPSDNSLREGKYFMTNANAFWHIVGDALGFRRGFHIDGRAEAVDFIRPHLLHDEAVDYDEAVARLTGAGYALWDAVAAIKRICFSTGAGSAKIFKKGNGAWLAEPGAFRCRDDAVSRGVFPKLPVDGDGVELCVMESVSPASNPRQTWSKAKQAAFDDEYAARPAAIYPYKRKHWFEVAFRDEPAVQKAPPFGSVPTDFRPEED